MAKENEFEQITTTLEMLRYQKTFIEKYIAGTKFTQKEIIKTAINEFMEKRGGKVPIQIQPKP